MRKKIRHILVTGGAGFIGSAFVRLCSQKPHKLIVVDKLTYAGDLKRLGRFRGACKLYKSDICDSSRISMIFKKERPDIVVNFAAETNVDKSIRYPGLFIDTNITGAKVLLDCAVKYGIEKFVQISTDEVYGDKLTGVFGESCALRPSSPYSATKASADLLISAFARTYRCPAVIVRPSNTYGPWQYPEKLIPLAVSKLFMGEKVPLFGKGLNVREWLFVDDCARGILSVVEKGRPGQIYNLGSGNEMRNIDVVGSILKILKKPKTSMEFVNDRPGHDRRYKLDCGKVFDETGWEPRVTFQDGILLTIKWCQLNKDWILGKWQNCAQKGHNLW